MIKKYDTVIKREKKAKACWLFSRLRG